MTTLKVKRGDIGLVFTDILRQDGEPIDLETADEVLFILRKLRADEPAVEVAAEIDQVDDADVGAVHYVTGNDDLDVRGIYEQEWQVTFASGQVVTVPSSGYNKIEIVADLNPDGS
jgi:hypothetical protein